MLLVDEAQNIPGAEESTEIRAITSYLHSSARAARILLACFGLGDTKDKLAATLHAGVLSREDSRYTIPIPSFADYLQQPDPCSG